MTTVTMNNEVSYHREGKGYLRRGKRIGLCCGEKGIPTEREEDRRERGLRV
jgi:hypothetical protein